MGNCIRRLKTSAATVDQNLTHIHLGLCMSLGLARLPMFYFSPLHQAKPCTSELHLLKACSLLKNQDNGTRIATDKRKSDDVVKFITNLPFLQICGTIRVRVLLSIQLINTLPSISNGGDGKSDRQADGFSPGLVPDHEAVFLCVRLPQSKGYHLVRYPCFSLFPQRLRLRNAC